MNFFNKLNKKAALFAVALSLGLGVVVPGVASAAQTPYDPNGTPTSKTPVFNHFTNVPSGVGDESDFVRLRPSSGDVTSTANNAAYTSMLNAACTAGQKFDVRTYVHNGADPNYNQNGTGSAVAHNVTVAQTAPLNTTNSKFTFASTISASNAASVSDTGVLNCGDKQVKLKLVPGSMRTYSKNVGFNAEADSAVNGTLRIGSRVHGSGDQWACFDDRVTVAYIVEVEELPAPKPVTAICDTFRIVAGDNRTIRVSQFKYTAVNATYKNTVINWDSGKTNVSSAPITDATKVEGTTYKYTADGTYIVTATVRFVTEANNDLAASTQNCQQQVTFTSMTDKPPVVVTTTTPAPPVKPVTLVAAGPATTIASFVAFAAVAGGAYYWSVRRRLV